MTRPSCDSRVLLPLPCSNVFWRPLLDDILTWLYVLSRKRYYSAKHITLTELISTEILQLIATCHHRSILPSLLYMGQLLPTVTIQKRNWLHITYFMNLKDQSLLPFFILTDRNTTNTLSSKNPLVNIPFPEWISCQFCWKNHLSERGFGRSNVEQKTGGVEWGGTKT